MNVGVELESKLNMEKKTQFNSLIQIICNVSAQASLHKFIICYSEMFLLQQQRLSVS